MAHRDQRCTGWILVGHGFSPLAQEKGMRTVGMFVDSATGSL